MLLPAAFWPSTFNGWPKKTPLPSAPVFLKGDCMKTPMNCATGCRPPSMRLLHRAAGIALPSATASAAAARWASRPERSLWQFPGCMIASPCFWEAMQPILKNSNAIRAPITYQPAGMKKRPNRFHRNNPMSGWGIDGYIMMNWLKNTVKPGRLKPLIF